MLIYIAKKEILEHLKSYRFFVAFLFIIVTFFVMLLARHLDYRAKYDDYLLRVKAQEEALDKYANLNRLSWLAGPIVPPSPMEIIVAPAVISDVAVQQSTRSLDDDPLDTVRLELDMIALIGLLGSLLALLLSYDSINREVHEGTLRLLLSTGIPRIKIIVGKILGGSIAATLPIASIFILTSLWLAVTGGLGWGINQWVSLLGISLVSLIYIMFFYCLGTFLSSIILDQTLSALSCFSVWIFFVFAIPILSPYIARQTLKIPDPGQVQREINYILNVERDDAFRKIVLPLIEQGLSHNEALAQSNFGEINRMYTERVNAVINNFKIAATRQTKLAARLACISPYSTYLLAVEEISGLGIERFQHLNNIISNWSIKFREYAENRFNEAIKQNPMFTYENKLDISNAPRFKYEEPNLSFKFSNAIPYILLIMAYFLMPLFLFLFTFNSKRTLL